MNLKAQYTIIATLTCSLLSGCNAKGIIDEVSISKIISELQHNIQTNQNSINEIKHKLENYAHSIESNQKSILSLEETHRSLSHAFASKQDFKNQSTHK